MIVNMTIREAKLETPSHRRHKEEVSEGVRRKIINYKFKVRIRKILYKEKQFEVNYNQEVKQKLDKEDSNRKTTLKK